MSRWTVESWGLQQALGSSHLSLWTNIAKERRKSTQQEDQSVNRLTTMYFCFVDIRDNINGNVIWGWEESYERDKLERVISGVSTFKEPLSEARGKTLVCMCLSVTQAVKHSVSQDEGAGGQAAEEMEVNQERESRATD